MRLNLNSDTCICRSVPKGVKSWTDIFKYAYCTWWVSQKRTRSKVFHLKLRVCLYIQMFDALNTCLSRWQSALSSLSLPNGHRRQERRHQEWSRELSVAPLPILQEQTPPDEPIPYTTSNAFDTNLFTQKMKHPVAYQQDEEILHVS